MASKKRKPNEPVPEQLATADTVGNTDQDDGGKEENDEDKVEVRLLVKVRKMLKKYSKVLMQRRNFTNKSSWEWWWSDVDRMERVKKIEQELPEQCHWQLWVGELHSHWKIPQAVQANQVDVTLLAGEQYSSIQYVLPTVKDVKEHIDLFKTDKLIGKTVKALSKEFDSYFR